jgi:hypothetical protein
LERKSPGECEGHEEETRNPGCQEDLLQSEKYISVVMSLYAGTETERVRGGEREREMEEAAAGAENSSKGCRAGEDGRRILLAVGPREL